jgi:transcriptional regulator with XRE-family HTH domain
MREVFFVTFYERVKALCEQRGISITALVRELGFSASAGTTWKASTNMPRSSTVKKVAEYFGLSVDELKKGIDTLNYADIDTSGFNQPAFRHLLQKYNGDEKQAIKAYLEFEKAQAHDAMSERPAVYHNSGANYGLIGTAHAPVKIINGSEHTLSDQEAELLRIFAELSVVEQSKVLIYASELKDKNK